MGHVSASPKSGSGAAMQSEARRSEPNPVLANQPSPSSPAPTLCVRARATHHAATDGKARAATEILDVRKTETRASSRLHSSSGKGAAAADQTARDAFKVVHPDSNFAPFNSPAARAADESFAASNPMHVGAQGQVPSNQDGEMESLKERTLRIYNETPDTMRQTNLSLGTEDGDEEESAVV